MKLASAPHSNPLSYYILKEEEKKKRIFRLLYLFDFTHPLRRSRAYMRVGYHRA